MEDEKILDAKYGKMRKPVNWIKMSSIAVCVLCVGVGCVIGLTRFMNLNGDGNQDACIAEDAIGGNTCDDALGDTIPTILYNDELYYWSGLENAPNSFEQIVSNTDAGEPQTAELPMEADFKAEGTIYANADYPEVIYVEMTTDWFTNKMVRFVTEELGNGERIAYQNRQYRMAYGALEDVLETLPGNCELIGKLHFIGRDSIPQNDLETNVPNDAQNDESMEGREVFACPNDTSKIYVTVYNYYKDGMDIEYQACYLWEE